MPKRIQRKRTKGWRMPPNTVYVGRPTMWGNPLRVGQRIVWKGQLWCGFTQEDCLDFYEAYISTFSLKLIWELLEGKNLACWCPLDQPCHADILLRIANN